MTAKEIQETITDVQDELAMLVKGRRVSALGGKWAARFAIALYASIYVAWQLEWVDAGTVWSVALSTAPVVYVLRLAAAESKTDIIRIQDRKDRLARASTWIWILTRAWDANQERDR